MKIFEAASTAVLLWSCVTPVLGAPVNLAAPTPGYIYFNRPGADISTHNADIAQCAAAVEDELNPKLVDSAKGALGPLVTGLVYNALWQKKVNTQAAADVENCMVVRGWRIVRVPDADGVELAQLSQSELTSRMEQWIGSSAPNGEVVRVWDNDILRASSVASDKAPFFQDGQLSWKIFSEKMTSSAEVVETYSAGRGLAKIDPKWPVKQNQSLRLSDISKSPPGSALIVIRVLGISAMKGRTLLISRLAANGSDQPAYDDHAPDFFGFLEYHFKTDWFVVAVPPGRWRIEWFGKNRLCLGAPAFEVKSDDVIYAGTFDMLSENRVPNLAVEPAKAFLSGLPAADAVRPAAYVNGSRSKCGFGMYAYEIPGAPFEPDYVWGSRASAAAKKEELSPSVSKAEQ